ncbi:16S rRNA (cytosine(1402)-N(4))-methyltransferase RsmH [Erythrobacteraceae bacterium CFH 75059]|uniref:16S rRNA (cytosine(1402)-N(4))-methyltransferase RsmH n=1 Tax=Qipengyuania thermophila TaxID=2509361 RepID=UPI00101F3B73|nr:16S rRNA (cytosine(1402)-N(4))-methyltransferase RsmH [Qipengyuania thermophila]TCD06185.1 16S rRNA (cytosine(1402)-N(4))-methyltransferase RsmH [Erythrobacteraceae bacterium CFH 75059]
MTAAHVPVLLDEVMAALDPRPGDVVVDATFGAGGYTRALLDRGARVHGFDRDPDAIASGATWTEAQGPDARLVLHHRRFSEMVAALEACGVRAVDGVVMDIGVSSMQLDQAKRGFAFALDGPLDMRMSQTGLSAADFLNDAAPETIADVLYRYGEERQSQRVTRAIVAARPLRTTGELARVVRRALGHRAGAGKDPATRTFQAIRIHVNGELDELKAGLQAAEWLLRENGRLAVVSFHSLEDRIVKTFLREASARSAVSRHLPEQSPPAPVFRNVSRPIRPSDAEVEGNPRARSAVLRHAARTAHPPREPAPSMQEMA